MGGDCLNVGCVPSKALIAAGERAPRPSAIGAALRHRPQRRRGHHGAGARSRPGGDRGDRARTIPPSASRRSAFASSRRRRASPGRDTVAAGEVDRRRAASSSPPARALRRRRSRGSTRFRTSPTRRVFDLFAAAASGSSSSAAGRSASSSPRPTAASAPRSSILEAARLLPRDDPEMAAVLERALLKDGVELRTGVTIERVEQRDDRVVVVLRSGDGAEIRRRQPPSRRGRAAAGHRGARARGGRDRPRQGRHHRRQRPAHDEPARLRHRRLRRRRAAARTSSPTSRTTMPVS